MIDLFLVFGLTAPAAGVILKLVCAVANAVAVGIA